jgi:hypothetical protein
MKTAKSHISGERGSMHRLVFRGAKLLLLIVSAVLLSSCSPVAHLIENPANTECVAFTVAPMPVPYCAKWGNGYCESTGYRYVSRDRCLRLGCKPGFEPVRADDVNLGCYAGDELMRRRAEFASRDAKRTEAIAQTRAETGR